MYPLLWVQIISLSLQRCRRLSQSRQIREMRLIEGERRKWATPRTEACDQTPFDWCEWHALQLTTSFERCLLWRKQFEVNWQSGNPFGIS